MSFLLKIVEGPNKGAEIALVEGVAVTLGKGDDCDIVLADQTLPDEPLKIEASAEGVAVDGEQVEPLAVKTLGATSFAVGPADAPWDALKWPKAAEPESDGPKEDASAPKPEGPGPESPQPEAGEPVKEEGPSAGKRRGCCGCLVAAAAVLLLVAGLIWFFRHRIGESGRLEQFEKIGRSWYSRVSGEAGATAASKKAGISDVAGKYGLEVAESNDVTRVSGNLRTRRERLAATAEAYQALPGVELDLTDDESFRASAEDALFTLTEGALKVVAATNRTLSVAGSSRSPLALRKVLESLNSDHRRLRGVDVSRVVISPSAAAPHGEVVDSLSHGQAARPRSAKTSKSASPAFPVCGILTTPYPCLVMRDGRRIMEGAALGGGVIVKIGADSVVITNSTGRFTWKP